MTDTDLAILKQELELAQMQGLVVVSVRPSDVLDLIRSLAEEVETRAEHECEPDDCEECETKDMEITDLEDAADEYRETIKDLKAAITDAHKRLDGAVRDF